MSEELKDHLRRLSGWVDDPASLEEPTGLMHDLELALHESAPFRLQSMEAEGRLIHCLAEWIGGEASSHDVVADVYQVLGRIAEPMQFISLNEGKDDVTFDVVLGDVRHGHRLRLAVGGSLVRKLLSKGRTI